MRILGISAYYHDSAAALIEDGVVVAAAQEERFTRRKHDPSFPARATRFCLDHAGRALADLDAVVFYEKPLLKLERVLESFFAVAPRGLGPFVDVVPGALRPKLLPRVLIRKELGAIGELRPHVPLHFSEHHLSHAASAFFPSPFPEAAILTVDGVGEWATASIARGEGASISVAKELHFPHSLGLFYSAMTWFLGFEPNDGEYKLMGLAPFGDETSDRHRRFRGLIERELVALGEDGSLALDARRFRFLDELRAFDDAEWRELFGMPRRQPEDPLLPAHADLALAVQRVTEDALVRMALEARRVTGARRLCLAGGVALNCVANRRILDAGAFERVWVQPAAGDAGAAIGAALALHHVGQGRPRRVVTPDGMGGALLGPEFGPEEVARCGRAFEAPCERFASTEAVAAEAARLIADGKVVGWFQGRAEWGPRALGSRSIVADPRRPDMQARLNRVVKHREAFRPFAPAVLAEDAAGWFDLPCASPYMLLTAPVSSAHRREGPSPEPEDLAGRAAVPRSDIPAVTHVDGSSRVQTVDRDAQPALAALLAAFKNETGCGVLVNTSFNVAGEPIVTTPEDAYRCFMSTGLDALVMGTALFRKEAQPPLARASPANGGRGSPRLGWRGRDPMRDLETVAALVVVLTVLGVAKDSSRAVMAAAALLTVCVVVPRARAAAGGAWDALTRLLGRAVGRILLGVLFLGVLTPLAWARRATSREPMLGRTRTAPRWIVRDHSFGPADLDRAG